MANDPDRASELTHTLQTLRGLMAPLERLIARLDQVLATQERMAPLSVARDPVPDRLHESLFAAGAVVPTRHEPQVSAGGFIGRYVEAVDRVRTVSFDTPPNRVFAHLLQGAISEISRWLAQEGTLDPTDVETLRRLRTRLVGLRHHVAGCGVTPIRPDDLVNRTLRMAPRYQPVLALRRTVAHLRQLRIADHDLP